MSCYECVCAEGFAGIICERLLHVLMNLWNRLSRFCEYVVDCRYTYQTIKTNIFLGLLTTLPRMFWNFFDSSEAFTALAHQVVR